MHKDLFDQFCSEDKINKAIPKIEKLCKEFYLGKRAFHHRDLWEACFPNESYPNDEEDLLLIDQYISYIIDNHISKYGEITKLKKGRIQSNIYYSKKNCDAKKMQKISQNNKHKLGYSV